MTDLLYSDVEEQLRSSVRDLLADRAPASAALARAESGTPYDAALWTALGRDLGAAGLAVAEDAGGHGASWREVAVVAEELGRSVAGTPFLGSAVLATALAQRAGATELLRALASGEHTATVAVPFSTAPGSAEPNSVTVTDGHLTGVVRSVADVPLTTHLLVPTQDADGPAVYLVETAAADQRRVVSFDLTRPLTDLSFDAATGTRLATGDPARDALDAALLAGAVILASEQLGVAQECLDLTIGYVKVRYQFARPIGSYQALKHRLADLWAAVTQARAVSRYAADCLATDDPDTVVAAALAQAYCSPLAVRAAEECVQLHGGIGFTWEHPAHLYLKRAKANSIALGTAAAHRTRLAVLVDLPHP